MNPSSLTRVVKRPNTWRLHPIQSVHIYKPRALGLSICQTENRPVSRWPWRLWLVNFVRHLLINRIPRLFATAGCQSRAREKASFLKKQYPEKLSSSSFICFSMTNCSRIVRTQIALFVPRPRLFASSEPTIIIVSSSAAYNGAVGLFTSGLLWRRMTD